VPSPAPGTAALSSRPRPSSVCLAPRPHPCSGSRDLAIAAVRCPPVKYPNAGFIEAGARTFIAIFRNSFNPFHMKEAKQTVSSTAIWLVVLNLSTHLLVPENVFLAGIIPGPKKSSLSDINHSVELLVEALREFFDTGVRYSRTARHMQGCLRHELSQHTCLTSGGGRVGESAYHHHLLHHDSSRTTISPCPRYLVHCSRNVGHGCPSSCVALALARQGKQTHKLAW
jgi:hypothetical protein